LEKQYLILGIHNHQPVGNFDFVFEECSKVAYLPFLKVLKAHPRIKISLHYSGNMWNWFLENSSPVLDLLHDMVARGQIELLSGGYYEPILAILPDRDKVGQIKKLNRFLSEHFQVRSRGMWLAERVWEPHLVKYICEAGIEYLAVDDLHFRAAGLQEEDLKGYYLTEEQGEILKVFPGSKFLRYSIPFRKPQETIDYILRKNRGKGNLTLMADDGEKFGVWPGTFKLTYEQKWLDKFFTLIEKNHDHLEILTFSEYLDRFSPLGKIYLPTASYSEMEEWTLSPLAAAELNTVKKMINTSQEFAEREKPVIKGGFWRNFLTKYSESNHIYQKMLWVSKQIEKCSEGKSESSPSQKWLEEARDELWKGQCNDAYWHGLFGGLYLPHLRHGVYKHLIQAENILDKNLHSSSPWIECSQVCSGTDKEQKLIIKTPLLNCYLDADAGATITELDYRPKLFNVINSLMRRQESHHQKLLQEETIQNPADSSNDSEVKSIHDISVSKEENLSGLLYYDSYARNCLIDHFLAPGTTLEEFSRLQCLEYGDFATGRYQKQIQSTKQMAQATFSRDGRLQIKEKSIPFRVEKRVKIEADKSELIFHYKLINCGGDVVRCTFGIEFNINLLGGRCEDRYYRIPNVVLEDRQLASQGTVVDAKGVQLIDEATDLMISFDFTNQPALWRFPIETASNSESGFERVYQSSVIFPHWDIKLNPKNSWTCDFRLKISNTTG